MKSDIQQMLATAYELEGLLLLAEARGDETSETVYRSIHEKIETLRRLAGYRIDMLCGGEFGDEVYGVTGFGLMEAVERTEARAFGGEDIAPDGKVSEISANENEEELEELSLLMAASPEKIEESAENPAATGEDSDDSADETGEDVEVELVYGEDEAEESAENPAATGEDTDDSADETGEDVEVELVYGEDEAEESAENPAATGEDSDDPADETGEDVEVGLVNGEEPYETSGVTAGESEQFEQGVDDEEPLRLDEVLSRHRSKDLKSAFSLNDMFRFRRELFGNSAAEMTDAIHLVEAMGCYDEAEDYFYGDLEWDKDSDEVKEFMSIIKKHFL